MLKTFSLQKIGLFKELVFAVEDRNPGNPDWQDRMLNLTVFAPEGTVLDPSVLIFRIIKNPKKVRKIDKFINKMRLNSKKTFSFVNSVNNRIISNLIFL